MADNKENEYWKQVKHKPVMWWNGKTGVIFANEEITIPNWKDYYPIPLYTVPPEREWVGLTDEDYMYKNHRAEFYLGAIWAESKLKEKNGGEENGLS